MRVFTLSKDKQYLIVKDGNGKQLDKRSVHLLLSYESNLGIAHVYSGVLKRLLRGEEDIQVPSPDWKQLFYMIYREGRNGTK